MRHRQPFWEVSTSSHIPYHRAHRPSAPPAGPQLFPFQSADPRRHATPRLGTESRLAKLQQQLSCSFQPCLLQHEVAVSVPLSYLHCRWSGSSATGSQKRPMKSHMKQTSLRRTSPRHDLAYRNSAPRSPSHQSSPQSCPSHRRDASPELPRRASGYGNGRGSTTSA